MTHWRRILIAVVMAFVTVSVGAPPALAAVPRATLGAAFPNGNISLFRAAEANGLPLVWAREFWAGSVPARLSAWPAALQAHRLGLKLWLSIDVAPGPLAAGNYDAQLAGFARTLPAGTRLTFIHEPSHKTNRFTPAQYVAAFDHAARLVQQQAPQVLTGPIDVRSNVLTTRFMDNLDPSLVDFVGLDAYDGINGGAPVVEFGTLVQRQVAHLRARFPNAPVGFAEFNTSRPANDRPRWIAAAMAWGAAHHTHPMLIFCAKSPWVLSGAEQRTLARTLNTR